MMIRHISLCLFSTFILSYHASAQQFTRAYTDKSQNSVIHPLYRIATDDLGNVINASSFSGTLQIGSDVYPSNGNLGAYIVKRDANDSILWSRALTCGAAVVMGAIYCDGDNNIYVTGLFGTNTTPTLSSTLSSYPHPVTIPSGASSFVVKYAPDGTVLWSRALPVAPGTNWVNADLFRISGNGTDRIVITAPFTGIPSSNVAGTVLDTLTCNVFYAVADSAGNWLHAAPVSANGTSYVGISVSMAPDGNVYLGGSANGTLTFGAAGSLTTGGLRDFVVKANTSGAYEWYQAPAGLASWWRNEVLADNGGVYFIGSFGGSIQFGTTTLTSGVTSTYMARLNASGNWINAAKFGTGESRMYAACRNANKVFITGFTDSNPGVTSNTFGTYLLDYTASLSSSVIQSNDMSFVIEIDPAFQVLKGTTFANSFATLNVSGMSASVDGVFLTGPVTGSAYFAGYLVTDPQNNSCNYVAKYASEANMITGQCYYDFNSNGVYDAADMDAVSLLELQSASGTGVLFANGGYVAGVDDGVSYTISIQNPPLYYTYSPSTHTALFPSGSTNQTDSLNDFAFQPIPNQNDLVIDLTVGAMRPGFSGTAVVTLRNVGTTNKSGNLDLILNDPNLTIDTVIPSSVSINNNSAVISYNLSPAQQQTWWIGYTLSANALLGAVVQSVASVADPSDLTPVNNADTVSTNVTGSYDPNNKLVTPEGDLNVNAIAAGIDLEYTINFQNTGTDTAFTVVVTDSIHPLLDLSSFELKSASHPVVVNIQDRQIWFRFYNINLPDSNVNEPLSHGYIRYRIRPLTTSQPGEIIFNTAYIYFDFNQPIITNTTESEIVLPSSVAENPVSGFSIFPNPVADGMLNIVSAENLESVAVYDVSGRLVFQQNDGLKNVLKVDLSQIRSGFYLLKAVAGRNVYTEIFTK